MTYAQWHCKVAALLEHHNLVKAKWDVLLPVMPDYLIEAYLNDKLTLVDGKSLIRNPGLVEMFEMEMAERILLGKAVQ